MRLAGLDKRGRAPYKDGLAQGGKGTAPSRGAIGPGVPLGAMQAHCSDREAGGLVRKKKPVDPVRQANKNRGYRIGWLIALAGIVCGFALVALKQG